MGDGRRATDDPPISWGSGVSVLLADETPGLGNWQNWIRGENVAAREKVNVSEVKGDTVLSIEKDVGNGLKKEVEPHHL